jgi:hypothetical protein
VFRPFAYWLSTTPLSSTLQSHPWIVPASQSLHIGGASIVFASALVINLRLLGVSRSGRSISRLTGALMPWIWSGLAVQVTTGILQTIIEPVREFVTPMYWIKMLLIVVVAATTALYARAVRRQAARWDEAQTRPAAARIYAVVSTLLWLAILACGRLIGYTWNYYA